MARLLLLLIFLSLFVLLGATISGCGDDDDVQEEVNNANDEIESAADDIDNEADDAVDQIEEEIGDGGLIDDLKSELDDLEGSSEEQLADAGDGLVSRCTELREDALDEEADVQEEVNEFCDDLETAVDEGDIGKIPELAQRLDSVADGLDEDDE